MGEFVTSNPILHAIYFLFKAFLFLPLTMGSFHMLGFHSNSLTLAYWSAISTFKLN